jgi:chromosome partitioning protein
MMTLTMLSQKGGAGKSTLALHLACEAVTRGIKVLLLDLDPQGSLASWGSKRGELPPDVEAVHPSSLAKTLAEAAQDGYDLTVLDTAPSADRAAMLAAEVADLIVVPCRPATFDIEAIQTTLEVTKLKKRRAVVVLNAAPIRSKVVDEARSAIVRAGGIVSPVVVCQRVAYQHCLIDGRTAGEYEPGGAAADEVTRLLHDMMTRLQPDAPAWRAA